MLSLLPRLWKESDANVRGRLIGLYALLIGANILVWTWAFVALRDNAVLFGSAFLAYTFGLRHAVDADHIAAIDNSTRKLMQQGQRPVGVGLYFSLGHSAVVVLLSIAVGFGSAELSSRFDDLKAIGGIVGASASWHSCSCSRSSISSCSSRSGARFGRSSAARRSRRTISTSCSIAAAFWRSSSGRSSRS